MVVWGDTWFTVCNFLILFVCFFFVQLRISRQQKIGVWNFACALAYYPGLLPFRWRLARGESQGQHYFWDVCGHLACTNIVTPNALVEIRNWVLWLGGTVGRAVALL